MIRYGNISICSKTRTITHGARRHGFINPTNGRPAHIRFKTIKHLLLADANGLTREQLFDHIYGDDVEGGPETGIHVFDVWFQQWVPLLKKLHLKIHREKRSGMMYLRLIPDVV